MIVRQLQRALEAGQSKIIHEQIVKDVEHQTQKPRECMANDANMLKDLRPYCPA
jgi:hypothetical protein